MKANYENKIRKALREIQDITEGLLPRGKYLMVVNRCGAIGFELAKKRRAEARGTGYAETVDPDFSGDEVRLSEEKKALDRERILAALHEGPVTTVACIEMGILRAGARVWELRKAGHNIGTRLIKSGRSRIAEYYLVNNSNTTE